MRFTIYALLLLSTEALTLVFVLDAQTPPLLSHLVSSGLNATRSPAWLITSASNFFTLMIGRTDVIGVIDATFSVSQTEAIEVVSGEMNVPVLVLGYASGRPRTPLGFHLRGTFAEVAASVETILRFFTWSRVNLVRDTTETAAYMSTALQAGANTTYDSVVLGLSDRITIDRIVGRSLRLKGNRISVLTCSPEVTKLVLSAQHRKQIGGEGFGNILVLDSSLYDIREADELTIKTGNLILMEEGMELISELQEYYREILSQALRFYEDYTDQYSLIVALQRVYPENTRPPSFSLINLQNGTRVHVGSISASLCDVFAPIYFLGNSAVIPTNSHSTIPLSANFGVRNAQSYTLSVLTYYCGTLLAIADINSRRDVLETFTLELYNFTAGVQKWNYQFAYENVFPNRNKLGLVVLTSVSSALTVNLFDFLRSLNYTGPLIGASNTVNALSSRERFPGYIRTIVPDMANIIVYVQMFKRYGWKKCGLFVSNEIWGLSFREGFLANAKSNGIEVVNAPELQILPTPIASVDVLRQNYTANFLDFINTKARILLLVINNNAVFVIDYLYELGLRRGELQVLACEMLAFPFISTSDPDLAYGRSQLLEGAVQFSSVSYVGAFGADVKQRLHKYTPEPPLYACFYYDAGLAIGYSFDLLVNLGEDYSDPVVYERALRGSKFVGCSGTVTFSLDSNDRTEMDFGIFNARSNGTSITSILQVGVYSPTSVEMFRFDEEILWSDGSSTAPADSREMVPGCPFEKKYDAPFQKGQHLVYELFSAYFLYLLLVCSLLYLFVWKVPVEDLTTTQQFELLDALVYWEIALEMGQYIGVGPSPSYFPQFLSLFFSTIAVDWDHLPYTVNHYEIVVWSASGLCLLTLIVWVVLLFQLDLRCGKVPGCKALGGFAELAVWLLSDWLFLPVANVLFTVFVCVRCNGATDYMHSYLQADCELSCWQGRHLVAVGVGAALLLLHMPLAIGLRPVWQGLFVHINIKTVPKFLLIKSIYQISIVLLKTALKSLSPTLFTTFFLLSEGLFTLISLKVKAFNYNRTRLWQRLSLVAAFWTSALTLLEAKLDGHVLLSLWLCGLFLLALAGGIFQHLKLPSLLNSQEGVNTMLLFRFAFQRTTLNLLTALQSSFSDANHPSTIKIPEAYLPTAEDLTSDSRFIHTSHIVTLA